MRLKLKISKTLATTVTILFLAMSTLSALPAINAQTDGSVATEVPTFLMLNVAPNPIGVGQEALINAFMTKPPITAGFRGTGTMYEGIKVEITKPDGTKATIDMGKSDSTGGTWTNFTPDQTGNYTFKATYPGQHAEETVINFFGPPSFYNITYLKSESDIVTLKVQEDPIPMFNTAPLPTEYWSRPIQAQNYFWAELGSNWYGLAAPAFATTGGYDATGNFQPYGTAPNTGHIMWVKPTHFGGQPGLPIPNDQMSNYMTTTIATNYFEPIILNGVLYYTEYSGPSAAKTAWVAVDIRTGETLWTRSAGESGNEVIRMGQVMRFKSIQEFGSWAFLYSCPSASFFGNPEYMSVYDAYSGQYLMNITNVQNPAFLIDDSEDSDQKGSLLGYYTSGGNLTMWNSSRLMLGADGITIRPSGTKNWSEGIEWTVKLPAEISQGGIAIRDHDVIILRYAPTYNQFSSLSYGSQVTAGYDAKTGKLLWGPKNQTIPKLQDVSVLGAGKDVYVLHNKDTNEAFGYSMKTGNLMWGPVKLPGNAWDHISIAAEVAYGKIFIFGFGGYVNAVDLQTGKIDWTYVPESSGYNTGYGIYPVWYNGMIADEKLFISQSHMYDPPVYPGAQQLAINTTTGKLVWSILSFTGRVPTAAADGYLIQWNSYDSQIYSIGKGPSSTTVVASPKISEQGTAVLVEGTVIDISAGTKDSDRSARFPHGVPAVSDESMSDWMEYVYMQQPKPTNATGVKVTISVLDPNGNAYNVGTTTSDSNGFYKLSFVPEVPGEYRVFATFEGSESYWPSSAETAIVVSEPEPTPTPTPVVAAPPYETYIIGMGIAVIVAVAVSTAALMLIIRKRP
ncbi:MAG: PQQ-binding-like beta-propeller repeat protein [Candidatus Bathyarchaeota archaeon]|nr:PQQ-binding-like beta-propeller repeat protein [Candidatus Bathyarchaeota archaeon]